MTIPKSNFSLLYARNIKGVWRNLTSAINLYPIGPLTVAIQFTLLPVSALFAGVKSLLDYATRTPASEQQYNTTKEQLNNLTVDEVGLYSKEIVGKYPAPKSKSSYSLIRLLNSSVNESDVKKRVETAFIKNQEMEVKMKMAEKGMVIQGFNVDANFLKQNAVELDKLLKAALNNEQQEMLRAKKTALISFFNTPHNNGKRTQNIIIDVCSSVPSPQ